MHSPLPDASALEAGILEDEVPSRLSRVQDNVRTLLRNSRFGSVHSSPPRTPTNRPANVNNGIPTPPASPHRRASRQPEVIPSPTAESTISTPSSTPTTPGDQGSGAGVPPSSYQRRVQQMAHQSALFNTRAVAALNHPDLTDPSLATYLRQKTEDRQRNSWKRSRHGRKRRPLAESSMSQVLLCIFAALLLAATVATYVTLALTGKYTTPTFHILFILGIILATIVFAHSVMRLLLLGKRSRSKRKATILSATRRKRRHHRHDRSRDDQPRIMPALSNDGTAFIPATPIQVHMPCDEVRPDSREAEPTATVQLEQPASTWDKDVDTVPNPPPAYGRWRGSVRANPDLLHWQAIPSPVATEAGVLPSPKYEQGAPEEHARPPSYVTRDSPARRREMHEARGGGNPVTPRVAAVESELEPEMVEGRGIGLAV